MAVPWLLSAVLGKQTPETLNMHQAIQRSRAAWHWRKHEILRREGRQEARGGRGGLQVRHLQETHTCFELLVLDLYLIHCWDIHMKPADEQVCLQF